MRRFDESSKDGMSCQKGHECSRQRIGGQQQAVGLVTVHERGGRITHLVYEDSQGKELDTRAKFLGVSICTSTSPRPRHVSVRW